MELVGVEVVKVVPKRLEDQGETRLARLRRYVTREILGRVMDLETPVITTSTLTTCLLLQRIL